MKPPASLSLDLDNVWSYLKIHGDAGWDRYPTYLDRAVPRFTSFMHDRRLRITVFVVGADAARAENRESLGMLGAAGHEIGNHSFHHEPWIAHASERDAYDELAHAHEAIAAATGREPRGFRGPGFANSPALLAALVRMGYHYDASRLPTFIGPLARWYYFRSAQLSKSQRDERRSLFGSWRDVLARNRAHVVQTQRGTINEIPVTTMPGARVPIHFSYLHYLERFSPDLAERYFSAALDLCRVTGNAPSLLLHPLDFLGGDDVPELKFFPGMEARGEDKLASTARYIRLLTDRFDVRPMEMHPCA
jgi:peptidoglycan/xylan/chitin deacetylase (PgdA/CDA1 family)